jgi:hypothetical protein
MNANLICVIRENRRLKRSGLNTEFVGSIATSINSAVARSSVEQRCVYLIKPQKGTKGT